GLGLGTVELGRGVPILFVEGAHRHGDEQVRAEERSRVALRLPARGSAHGAPSRSAHGTNRAPEDAGTRLEVTMVRSGAPAPGPCVPNYLLGTKARCPIV